MPYSRKQADHILEVFDKRAYAAKRRIVNASQTEVTKAMSTNKAALDKIDKKTTAQLQKILDDWAISNIMKPMICDDYVRIQSVTSPELEAELKRINAERKAARAEFLPVMAESSTAWYGYSRELTQDAANQIRAIEATRAKLEMRVATEDSTISLENFFNEAKI